MKKTILIAALALASMTAHATWETVKSDNGNVSAIALSSINGINSIIGVAFDAHDNCIPHLKFMVIVDYNESMDTGPYSMTDISVHMRVDTGDTWTATQTRIAKSDNVLNHDVGPINAEAIGQLMTGSVVRLKIETDNAIYDRFSLKGSAKAISKASAMCKPINDSDFFEKPQMTEDAKFFRGA